MAQKRKYFVPGETNVSGPKNKGLARGGTRGFWASDWSKNLCALLTFWPETDDLQQKSRISRVILPLRILS